MRGVWRGLKVPMLRVPDRALIGNPGGQSPPGSSGGLRNYRHLFELMLKEHQYQDLSLLNALICKDLFFLYM
jgi:hypothetical protein